MIISINGPAGSGKSTIAKMLAEKLGWPRYYIGGLRREKARARGLTLAEYNRLGETDPSTDLEVDEYQTELGKKEDNFVIEGRTSWHFIPHSLKVYLDVEEKIGAERVFRHLQTDNRRNEDKDLDTAEAVLKSQRQRLASDRKRYKKYFGIDAYDQSNYDLVIDASRLSQEEAFARLWQYLQSRL